MYKVAFSSRQDYEYNSVRSGIKDIVDRIGGFSHFIEPGDRVLIKPNLLSARPPEKRTTTDPVFVMAVTELVIEAGGKPVIADSPPGVEPFALIRSRTKMGEVSEITGAPVIELTCPRKTEAEKSLRFKNLEIAAEVLEADVVINLPKMKTHGQMLLTLGVKNMFGTVISREKAEWHYRTGLDRDIFATLLLDIYNAAKPALTILDGIWGMEGHGPSNGRPRNFGIIGASEDALALDLSVSRLIGVESDDFPLYRVAKKYGLPQAEEKNIEVSGDLDLRVKYHDVDIPKLDSLHVLPPFLRFMSPVMISKPVQDKTKCIGCGECVRICKAEAIELRDNKILEFDYRKCIRCFCCQEVCPAGAISFKSGLIMKLRDLLNRKDRRS